MAIERISHMARELKGEVSGERGIDYVMRPYIKKANDLALLALMQAVKAVFDPDHILTPTRCTNFYGGITSQ